MVETLCALKILSDIPKRVTYPFKGLEIILVAELFYFLYAQKIGRENEFILD